jgi:hypothetical protein
MEYGSTARHQVRSDVHRSVELEDHQAPASAFGDGRVVHACFELCSQSKRASV